MASLVRGKAAGLEPVEVHALAPEVQVAPATADAEAWARYFENIYRSAQGDPGRVPWAKRCANPALVAWLNAEASSVVRPGATVTVVGCGLGHDVRELACRGYDAVGFDVAAGAIEWARREHPSDADRFLVADLFDLPHGLARRADLVVEINTMQAIHPSLRESAAAAIASLARPRGLVLTICRGRDETELLETITAPPYPLCLTELCGLMESQGLHPTKPVDDFVDDGDPPVRRLRATFRR